MVLASASIGVRLGLVWRIAPMSMCVNPYALFRVDPNVHDHPYIGTCVHVHMSMSY